MACFGCSYTNDVRQDFEEDLVKTGSVMKKKKRKPWISWSRYKKSAAVSASMSGNLEPVISQKHLLKMDKVTVVPSKKHRHPTGVKANNKTYKKKSGTVKDIILENSEIKHLTSLARDDKLHDKKHSSRKKETNKNGSSSPPDNETPTTANRADPTSLPPHREKKTKTMNGENGDDNVTSVKNQNKEALDSIFGMLVIVVILLFILFWGKLCAVLCTSAWFYMFPRLRTAVDSNAIVNNALESDELNLNSDEHKKKVVLEGLLQRNRPNVFRLL